MLLEKILPLVREGKSITRDIPGYKFVLSGYTNSYTGSLNWKCTDITTGNGCKPTSVPHNDLLTDDWIVVENKK